MKKGRINERNIGTHKLDGGAKRQKVKQNIVELTYMEQLAASDLRELNALLSAHESNYYAYVPFRGSNPLHVKWLQSGIASTYEHLSEYAKAQNEIYPGFNEPIVALKLEKPDHIKMAAGIIKHFYPKACL